MPYFADFHIHSHYSRATSPECSLEGLQRWAQLKGLTVVGTGDATHPEWLAELQEKLEPAGPGLFKLRSIFADPVDRKVPSSCRNPVYFLPTAEISCIYKRGGRVRKIHALLLYPDFNAVNVLNRKLDAIGNLKSDGRPILGLDAEKLLAMALEASPEITLIPAHIWTPWFSLLGDQSGFDSLEECFGDLSPQVTAVETGLSSDPPLNWRVSRLDRLTRISNSDIHSPGNLGRNATVFTAEPSYPLIREGLKTRAPELFGGTLDLFPEEGKYHFDGHRACNVRLEPEDSIKLNGICPVCSKPLTIGVLHRVVELADRPAGEKPPNAPPHEYVIPLPELLAEINGSRPAAKKVVEQYNALLERFGPELTILRDLPPAELDTVGRQFLAEALRRLRSGKVFREGGFDGQYGIIRVFNPGELPVR